VKILVTGACGFVGSTLARAWVEMGAHELLGVDSLVRPGSESNRALLRRLGVRLVHADLRSASDFDSLPAVDVVVDAAANPSVLAGVDGSVSSRQVVEHNLAGTINILEYCRKHQSAFVLLSTSRVYAIEPLSRLAMRVTDGAFEPDPEQTLPVGLSRLGVDEAFSVTPPLSLYGATKLASETIALEYGETYSFPVWINRCGVLAGAGQFGRADQGIYAFWINSWLRRRPMRYIGFDGEGHQVRDCLHPADLVPLIESQVRAPGSVTARVVNVSGGVESAMSLRQLSEWCGEHIGQHEVGQDLRPRRFDIPWLVLNSTKATEVWDWRPSRATTDILAEILAHAREHPEWLELSES